MNEFRATGKEAFTNLLSIMEGFPGDVAIKGGFTPVRIKKLIITCPRPPKALSVMLGGYEEHFEGEFATKDKYDPQHLLTAWEDVDQVIERIRESGGKLVCHQRYHPMLDHGFDESVWKYRHVTIIGQSSSEEEAGGLNSIDAMLDEI